MEIIIKIKICHPNQEVMEMTDLALIAMKLDIFQEIAPTKGYLEEEEEA